MDISHGGYSGCAAIIIRKKDQKTFLTQRKLGKSFGGGLWEIVGGSVEPDDEGVLACITREIKEELDADIKNVQDFKDYTVVDKDGGIHLVKTFIVELISDPQPNPEDSEASGWFDRGEIEKLKFVSNVEERLVDYFLLIDGK